MDQPSAQSRSVRKRSEWTYCGLPLYDVAIGPDFEKGEMRGRACGMIAIGDIATGGLAIGGMARGIIDIGGLAVGAISFGGFAVGLLALGGGAVGLLAMGGAAVGLVAVGGGAVGYFAAGGGTAGEHVLSAAQRDPEAVAFFARWFPFLPLN